MKNRKISRREFIGYTSIGAGSLVFGGLQGCGSIAKKSSPTDPFQTVTLGKSGIKMSLLSMGTGSHGWMRKSNLTRQDKDKSIAAIRHAFDRGIRFFDCADLYGTHGLVAEALKNIPRDQYVLSSKIWVRPNGIPEKERPDANIIVDRVRKELNTDYIDLFMIHCMEDANWPVKQKRQMDILADLKAKKIIRAHGVSVHSLDAMQACIDCDWVDSVHVRINAFGDSMDNPDPKVVAPVASQLHKAGKGVVAMKLVGNGNFTKTPEKIDQSLKYVLGLNCVDTILTGFETPEQIDNFAQRLKKALEYTT